MNSLLIFGFSLLALGSCFPHSKEISEQDKEVLLEANRNFKKLEDFVYPLTNLTVLDIYRSIVYYNIADESIIQEAKDFLNKWENETEKYPPFTYYLRLEDLFYWTPKEANKWNLWTAGLYKEKLNKMLDITGEIPILCNEIWQTMLCKVSDSTEKILLEELADQLYTLDIWYPLSKAVSYRNSLKMFTE